MGADCDHVDSNGQTPLYYAVKNFWLEAVEYLIKEAGANVNHDDKKHETPMIIAKRTGKKQLINLLIQNGAKTFEDLHKTGKGKRDNPSITTELVKDLPPSLLKKTTTNDSIKTETLPGEKKQAKRFVLTHLKDGVWQPLSNEELDRFEWENPDIAKYWKDQGALETL